MPAGTTALLPVSSHEPPSFSARVTGSKGACIRSSDRAVVRIDSPEAAPGSQRACWATVPKRARAMAVTAWLPSGTGATVRPDLDEHAAQLDQAEAAAVVLLGNGEGEQAGLAQGAPQLAVEATFLGVDGTKPVRGAVVLQDRGRQVCGLGRLRGGFEVHAGSYRFAAGRPRPTYPMMSRWISLVPPPKVITRAER